MQARSSHTKSMEIEIAESAFCHVTMTHEQPPGGAEEVGTGHASSKNADVAP